MNKKYRWIFASLLLIIIVAFGFTFTVREGSAALVSRFGQVRTVHTQSGLHMKLPWPFEKIISYDTRSQYMDSGYTETLTNDKKNIILQTYIIWKIEDPAKYYKSVGDNEKANKYLNDLVSNVKNGVLGGYELSALVSTDLESIKIREITEKIEQQIMEKALSDYGIGIEDLSLKRLALPKNNIDSVLEQMIADRQKQVTKLLSEGERDAAIIKSEASSEAAKIISAGQLEAAEIDAETERRVAEIYGDAYDANSELFIFLKKLIALENSVSEDTVLIMKSKDSPFDVISGLN